MKVLVHHANGGRVQQGLLDQGLRNLVDLCPRFLRWRLPARASGTKEYDGHDEGMNQRLFRTVIEVASMRWRLKGDQERAPR
jgi:hypothetical protein